MQKHILGIVFISLLFSSCCADSEDILLNIAIPEVAPTPCDGATATPYQNSFTLEQGTYLSQVHPSKGSVALCITPNGIAWYDFQAQVLLAEVNSKVASKAFSYPEHIHANGNLVCAASATGIAVVDMEAKKLVWERNVPDCSLNGSDFTGLGNRFFAVGKVMGADNIHHEAIFSGTMETGNDFGRFIDPKYSRQVSNGWMGYGRVNEIKAFKGNDNEAYLLISFSEPVDNNKVLNYTGLYNLDRQSWVYEREPLSKTPLQTGVLCMEVSSGTTARMALGDSLFVWDVMAGASTMAFQLPMGNYGQHIKALNLWSNDQYTLVQGSENEILAFENQTNRLFYRIPTVNANNVSVCFDQDLFMLPSYTGCRVFELSTGLEIMTIQAPCEGNLKAQFSESVACWTGTNGKPQIALQSKTMSYLYEVVK